MKADSLVPLAAVGLLIAVALSAPASAAPLSDGPAIPKGQHSVELESVDAVTSTDVWAVGARHVGDYLNGDFVPLVKHWDGSSWRTIPSYDHYGVLHSVAAVSANDVWAVGEYKLTPRVWGRALLLHWDGTSWSDATPPKCQDHRSTLTDVSFTSPTNVLVRGFCFSGGETGVYITLIWDGSSWQDGAGPVTHLISVAALSPKDAWGVGLVYPDGKDHSYVAHWNGRAWKHIAAPDRGALTSVAAISRNDVWAAGHSNTEPHSFFEHWDGTSWTVIDDPHASKGDLVTGISGTASDDIWASGYFEDEVLQHWNGHEWSDSDNPFTGKNGAKFRDVVAISRADAWAVGSVDGSFGPQHGDLLHKILMHWDGVEWSSNTTHHQPS